MEVEAAAAVTVTVGSGAGATVEHVTKSSSDQLLSKFADDDAQGSSAKMKPIMAMMAKGHRQRSSSSRDIRKYVVAAGGGDHHCVSAPFDGSHCDCDDSSSYPSSSLVERRTLLPCPNNNHHRRPSSSAVLLRQLGFGNGKSSRHHHLRAGTIISFRNKSLLGSIHKTWRRTVQGASKVLLTDKQQQPPLHLHLHLRYNNRHKRLHKDQR